MGDLELTITRLALSKLKLAHKFKYFILGAIFYLFLLQKEKNRKIKDGGASDASSAGDDVYPLF